MNIEYISLDLRDSQTQERGSVRLVKNTRSLQSARPVFFPSLLCMS
jgi:hypothetical protein